MNRRLINFNPEGQGARGEVLLFGTPPRRPTAAPGDVAELEFASAFLEAGNLASLAALVNRVMRYAGLNTGRPISEHVARPCATPWAHCIDPLGIATHTEDHPARRRIRVGNHGGRTNFRHRVRRLERRGQEFETARYFVRFALGAARGTAMAPALGARIGTGLANAAGKAIGLELEFGENEELEFTGARQFVHLASDTARQAAAAAAAGADPRAAAQTAAIAAARKFAPGLVGAAAGLGAVSGGGLATGGPLSAQAPGQRGMSGRWLRRGRHIVLFGV